MQFIAGWYLRMAYAPLRHTPLRKNDHKILTLKTFHPMKAKIVPQIWAKVNFTSNHNIITLFEAFTRICLENPHGSKKRRSGSLVKPLNEGLSAVGHQPTKRQWQWDGEPVGMAMPKKLCNAAKAFWKPGTFPNLMSIPYESNYLRS